MNTLLLTSLALVAFAANSILCRLALGTQAIDATSFTIVRLLSGSLVLMIILWFTGRGDNRTSKGSWPAGLALFLYAAAFSYAYISLDTGTGALILFGAVQITMIAQSIRAGNRLNTWEWMGVGTAFAGFLFLVLPGVSAPDPSGFLLMSLAGVAWGVYTLMGKGSKDPLADTSYNFLRTTPMLLILVLMALASPAEYSNTGILLAVLSGAIASGLGYTVWYTALRGLSATQAAVVQLSVPVIAAVGGVAFLEETITLRLLESAVLILGGILLVVLGRHRVSTS
jgi:drug/metabolite transporter (DMT)-like permease